MGTPTLFTIGHGTMNRVQLVGLANSANVEYIADVRSFPGSRHNQDAKREEMEHYFPAAGIDYGWWQSLGGFRPKVHDSIDTVWRHPAFQAYAGWMRTDDFRAAMEELLDLTKHTRVAVMCSESVSWKCHRRMITDYFIKIFGGVVMDIMPNGKLRPTKVMEGMRVRPDGRIVYDAGVSPLF